MPIEFDTIPTTRIPGHYVELNTRLAARGLPQAEAVVVLLGQKRAAGSATVAVRVQVLDDAHAADLFGEGSMLHRMAIAAFTANRYMGALYAVPLSDDAAGVTAAGTFTFTVGTLVAGTLTVYIGHDAISIDIGAADTATLVAAALAAAINDQPELPVAATSALGVVTVTCRHKGVLGNSIDLEASYSASGLTTVVVAMAGGTTDPDAQTALDSIYATDCDVIVFPWNNATDLDELKEHLSDRSDGVEQRGAVGVSAIDTTVSTATALASARNSGRMTIALLEATRTWAPELAAAYAAVIAGEADLAKPLNDVKLKGVHSPAVASRFTRAELTSLLANGVTPIAVGPDEVPQVVRSITTYVENTAGAPDATLLDLQTIRVLDYTRKSLKAMFAARFTAKKIADTARTSSATDPKGIRAAILDTLYQLEAIDYLENVEDNSDGVVVERNATDTSRVDAVVPADIVNGLHVLATRIDLIL